MIQQEAGHESGVEPVRDADELKATEAWILRIVNEMLGNLGLIPPSLADLELLKLEARKIKDSAETDKTIIVLRGPAGTGKTSLINNLVGYRLLATSWNGACTTVATELHYTDKDEHTAIIHYVSKVEWFEELRAYCDEETDELEDVSFPNDSIAMTINKLSTLYPGKGWQRGNPKRWTPKTIMDMERGQTRLGSTEAIDAVSAERFREALKKYNDPHFSRVWPFIKLIRIKTKSDILRYGAVLVDLPGTNDSNVARNSVAASYGKIYDQTWVTINIKRAKTDSDIDEFLRRLQDEQVESDRGNIRFVITHCDDGMQNFDTAQMIRDVPALAKNEEFQKSVDQLKQQYRQKRALERAKKALNHIRTRPSGTSTPTLQRNGGEEFSQVITQLDEVSESIEENKRKLGTIFSQARSQDVAESLESKFRRVTSLCTSRSRELGIHFVGNNDYRALTCDDVDEVVNMSSCFGLVQDTGVPELASLILKTSQRKLRARTAKRLEKLKNLCLDIELEMRDIPNTSLQDRIQLCKRWGDLKAEGRPSVESEMLSRLNHLLEIEITSLRSSLECVLENALRDPEFRSVESLVEKHEDFVTELCWSSYRSAIRKYGDHFVKSQNKEFNLNQALARVIVERVEAELRRALKRSLENLNLSVRKLALQFESIFLSTVPKGMRSVCSKPVRQRRSEIEQFFEVAIPWIIQEERLDRIETVSFRLAPFVKRALILGYEEASLVKGPGSLGMVRSLMNQAIRKTRGDFKLKLKDFELENLVTVVRRCIKQSNQRISKGVEAKLSKLWWLPPRRVSEEEDGEGARRRGGEEDVEDQRQNQARSSLGRLAEESATKCSEKLELFYSSIWEEDVVGWYALQS